MEDLFSLRKIWKYIPKKEKKEKRERLNLVLFQFETKCKSIKYELYVVNS